MALSAVRRVVRSNPQGPKAFRTSIPRMNAAWPGDHTQRTYDGPSQRQVSFFAQLRTGTAPLNGYLHLIKATETSLCDCGEATESRISSCSVRNSMSSGNTWEALAARAIFRVCMEAGHPMIVKTGHRTRMPCQLPSTSPERLSDFIITRTSDGEHQYAVSDVVSHSQSNPTHYKTLVKLGVKKLVELCIYYWGHPLLYTFSGSVMVWMLLSGNLEKNHQPYAISCRRRAPLSSLGIR